MLAIASVVCAPSAGAAAPPSTLRVDYLHTGDATSQHYAIDRVVVEPLPWPGNPARPLDDTNRGINKFEVVDRKSGRVLYSRGFSTVFGEWRTTDEAAHLQRGFQESLRFPMPDAPVTIKLYERDSANAFVPAWSIDIDPAAQDVQRVAMPAPATPIAIRENGPSSDKVDLLVLGDGYTAAERDKFIADTRRMTDHLFTVSPFKEHAGDFNVWAMMVPTPVSGVSRPSTGTHHASMLGARYDIFGSERYVLATDNRALREIAQNAPYEFIEILVNNRTYGGGGIFGQFSTAAADNAWADYLFVHEFGHHFAGLGDEYYTSPVAYQSSPSRIEPWEPNVTALHDPSQLKWRRRVAKGTALPTPWPKAEYDARSREYQKVRAKLRADNRPEAEMEDLFRTEKAYASKLFSTVPNPKRIGAFEGANYESTGYYRPRLQCLMFDRSEEFCQVCADAIAEIIDLYSLPTH
ncbi:IgA Peptidase M64 [Lysobacter fragariae]